MDWNLMMKTNKLWTICLLSAALTMAGNFTNAVAEEKTTDELEEAANVYNKNKSDVRYEVVCKREAPVGTRIKKKVCRTVASVQNSQREVRKMMREKASSIGNKQ